MPDPADLTPLTLTLALVAPAAQDPLADLVAGQHVQECQALAGPQVKDILVLDISSRQYKDDYIDVASFYDTSVGFRAVPIMIDPLVV